ncbi:cellulose synthase [Lactiplantibacillus paraplantarum]|uniref:cellulose biosynthesis cyclic di-GMP-binding regulatory protein BcsB n=1 Tax=Lactiplantibacillus paraplantarum TaxID=60520 RepID=UPI0021A54E6D|nr:cellulose biosynthesis cyclic di-GMP-binding regulatory protein BcsB [Lactiplantibacillus paraplantarum]MCT4458316.1 cellulose synthase [Lactiplantibacillus paraplantarum]
MFVNKFFINKQNGIKLNGISNWLFWGLAVLALLGGIGINASRPVTGQATSKLQTYTQPFQNSTTTLSGDSVEANMYFIKMDYWQVKKVTINLNFQVSQLANRATSDITLSLNGTKFYSFRPKNQTGLQTKAIEVPLRLIQGENQLKISGQILNKKGNQSYQLAQTPANWLTIYSGANANFEYRLQPPTTAIKSFYAHFSGTDTIANTNSVITLPQQASNAELTAGMYALTGEARTITTENTQIPVTTTNTTAAKQADYHLVMATYQHLPKVFQQQLDRQRLQEHSVIKTYTHGGKYYLIVSALDTKLLQKASRFIANQELMQETTADTKYISNSTQTFTSELQYGGKTQLTTSDDYLTGAKHQSSTYFVSLPVDRTNADGSKIRLHFRYAKNLDFKRSLITVYVNDSALGSKRLTAARANNDELTVSLPKGKALGHSFTIRVAFDLEMKGKTQSDNAQTPWALISSDSEATIKSKPVADLLFTNYPYLFLKNSTFNHIAVVRPRNLTGDDFQTLTNIFNLIGTYAQSNTGTIQFYTHKPSKTVLKNSNVIAFGTPKQSAFIRSLNPKLYFKYNQHFTGFLSNEKLSVEKTYGQNIGTAQLLRSPYNQRSGLLVVTAVKSSDVYRASTQINFQRNIAQYQGDAIVVDHDNNHYDYRFKKHQTVNDGVNVKMVVQKNSKLVVYLGIALLIIIIILLAGFLIMRKSGLLERKERHHE